MKEMNNKPVRHSKVPENEYRCYSVKLNAFLKEKGLQTIQEVRNTRTDKIAFIYERSAKLDKLLTEWQKNKTNNRWYDKEDKGE